MKTGKIDVLGFIGGTKGADALIQAHPSPHRLKVFAQLEVRAAVEGPGLCDLCLASPPQPPVV